MIMSSITLGERVGPREYFAAGLSFSGVLLVANPTESFTGTNSTKLLVGVSLALLASVSMATTFTTARYISGRVNFMASVLSFGLGTILFGFMMGAAFADLSRVSRSTFVIAFIGSFSGFLGQVLLNKAFQHCNASVGAMLRTVDIPIAYALGVVFLNEVPHTTSLIGSLLVIVGAVIVGSRKVRTVQNGPQQ